MKLISWNVNGIRAAYRKGLSDFMQKEDADIYCFQEIKAKEEHIPEELKSLNYHQYFHPAERPGYAGVAVYSKTKPLSVVYGINNPEIDKEGRVLILEFEGFYLINAYFPQSSRDLARLPFKLNFNKVFHDFCKQLNKPIIIASDFNVAHQEIDLRNPKTNQGNAGFTEEEREWFTNFLDSGHIDTFRSFTTEPGHYTWWQYAFSARERNIGWRIDYFVVSEELKEKVVESYILPEVMGSDHCPIGLEIFLSKVGFKIKE